MPQYSLLKLLVHLQSSKNLLPRPRSKMFKLTWVALALCLAVAIAETQTGEILHTATAPLTLDPTPERMADMDTEEHKLKTHVAAPKYAALPIYGVPSYGIPTYAVPSFIPSYGLPTLPNYGYPSYSSYPSYGYGYSYPLPLKMGLLGHKMKYHL